MTRKIIYIEAEKNYLVKKKELILEKPGRSTENVSFPKKESDSQQIIRYQGHGRPTRPIKYFIKEEVHDHRKATKLVMSLQSCKIKHAGALLLEIKLAGALLH